MIIILNYHNYHKNQRSNLFMDKAKVKKEFANLPTPSKASYGIDRVADMTASADLNAPGAPFHTLADGTAACTALQTAINNAAGGGFGTPEALQAAISY